MLLASAGTRIRHFRESGSRGHIDDIMEWFDGLDREQAKAVIGFAARSLAKAPAYAP
jgi:hypothetical protein